MKLTDKIESYDDYLQCDAPNGERMRTYMSNGRFNLWRSLHINGFNSDKRTPLVTHVSNVPAHLWWMHREEARVTFKVYDPPTSVLVELHNCSTFSQYFVHISTKDPTQIAFTPSVSDGQVDRQVHMSLGRFLRKYSLGFSDPEIAMLEARHRSELSPEVKLHSFLDEWDTCLSVYKHISSCMGKDESVFHSDIHPVAMYKAPGYHLATLYNDRGTASARCIVYINPDDPKDKRWIRVYGDVVLSSWLKKNDFLARPLTGTWLHTHKLPRSGGDGVSAKARILMAYLDPGSDRDGKYQNGPAVWDGKDRLYLLPKNYDVARFPNAFIPQSTSGYLDVLATPVEVTSLVSGKVFNAMQEKFEHVWVNGKRGYALSSEITGFNRTYIERGVIVWTPPDTPRFAHGSAMWLDTQDMRMSLGYVKLSMKFYPDAQEWVDPERKADIVRTPDGHVRKEDAVILIIGGNNTVRVHTSMIEDSYHRVASIDEIKTFATPGTVIVRTTANRLVVPGVHPIVQLYNGEWMYTRHATSMEVFGTTVWVPKDAAPGVLDNMGLPASIKSNIAQMVLNTKRNDAVVRKVIYQHLMSRGDVFVPLNQDDNKFEWSYVWAASEVVVGPIRALLTADKPIHVGATQAAADRFTRLAKLLIDEVDARWAEKAAAEVPTAVEAE